MKQVTLNDSFCVKGKGLHTGLEIEATFCPAPENHGFKVQRIDLEGEPIIDALAEYVTATTRGTVISRGEVSVSTIEHAMAALYAAGIDNCLIKLNAPELPILDGSAKEYFELTYEGYGPCGIAVIVETLTDNRNRTAGDLRHYFDKYGGNLFFSVNYNTARRQNTRVDSADIRHLYKAAPQNSGNNKANLVDMGI